MLIEDIIGSINDYDLDDYDADPVVLDHETLAKPHQKVKTAGGREIAISLPRGINLHSGAVLAKEENLLIYVEMTDEDLLEIFPKSNVEWGRTAFNIGNMHHPAYISEKSIKTPYDPNIERIIKELSVKYERKTGQLTGKRANVSQEDSHSHNSNPGSLHGDENND